MTAAPELLELRRRVASELTTVGSGPQVKAGVQSMAELPLPLNQKYLSIDAAAIVRGNTIGNGRAQVMERMGKLVKALNVLEKYGLNLHNLARPRYWRSVKHNNPIFKAQVDSMQGGRGILYLYGYTVQQIDGLVFPEDVLQPDRDKVAAVTLEVMCLGLEVEMLIKGNHPHPEFFKDVLPLVVPEGNHPHPECFKDVLPLVVPEGNHPHPECFKDVLPLVVPEVQQQRNEEAAAPLRDVNSSTALPPKPTRPPPLTPTKPPLPPPIQKPPSPPAGNPTPSLDFYQSLYTTPPSSPPPNPPTSLTSTAPRSSTALPPKPAPRRLSRPPPGPEPPAAMPSSPPPASDGCHLCGAVPTVTCASCSPLLFCDPCDGIFHRNPARANHKREPIPPAKKELCSICGVLPVDVDCPACVMKFCLECDGVYHLHPERTGHQRPALTPPTASSSLPYSSVPSPWTCGHCSVENPMQTVLCDGCERPRLATPSPRPKEDTPKKTLSLTTDWRCTSCTVMNEATRVLCGVCERPRLAHRPSLATLARPSPKLQGAPAAQWTCQACTYQNPASSTACEMCASPSGGGGVGGGGGGGGGVIPGPAAAPAPAPARPRVPDQIPARAPPQDLSPDELLDQERRAIREDSLLLVQHIKEAEKRGVSAEEVCAALASCGGSNVHPCDWLDLELPHLLDEICAMATSSAELNRTAVHAGTEGAIEEGLRGPGGGVGGAEMQLSRAEAKGAWLAAGGDVPKAVKRLLRERRAKMRELRSLGFQDAAQCHQALRQSGGELGAALVQLQWPLVEPFHRRLATDQPKAPIDAKNHDKQRTCRRLLAFYDLPSWGRCELVLSLLQEEEVEYTLEDVVEAVMDSTDREYIVRILKIECQMCLCRFPQNKLQSLTSCQCVMCQDCFKHFFEFAVREKHVTEIVCQFCTSLDQSDPEQMDTYFSTLDTQLRGCLDPESFDIYSKKLMEYTIMKDPKFLWCCHCTFGFIYEGIQIKIQCSDCKKSFCSKCKKPWEPQHKDLSCEMFLQWKRENDPEWQKQGLAGFLQENGITCPSCGFQYALAKGGCMHFTCSQCKHQFCSGCNNPFHKALCKNVPCTINSLHAHHPRDCLFYMRDWEPERLKELLQLSNVAFNTEPPADTENLDACSVMQQKEEGGQLLDKTCGNKTEPGQAGLCEKHYREYLVSLINDSSLDPAPLYDGGELAAACARYSVVVQREEGEEDDPYSARLLMKLKEVPLGENVPRRK